MFGFQRVGDLIWAAADQRARGFLLGATAGRTTLGGEGLQHQDGTSPLIASTVPNCRVWDPCFAGEVALILQHGAQNMLEQSHDEFHYILLTNENYPNPSMPVRRGSGRAQGLYRYRSSAGEAQVRLVGSGSILREVIAAAEVLHEDFGICAEVWSATSYSELQREAVAVERANRVSPRRASAVQSRSPVPVGRRPWWLPATTCALGRN